MFNSRGVVELERIVRGDLFDISGSAFSSTVANLPDAPGRYWWSSLQTIDDEGAYNHQENNGGIDIYVDSLLLGSSPWFPVQYSVSLEMMDKSTKCQINPSVRLCPSPWPASQPRSLRFFAVMVLMPSNVISVRLDLLTVKN